MQETNVFFTKIRKYTDEKPPPMQYANGDISPASDLTCY